MLQRNNIHIKVCSEGQAPETLKALRESSATSRLNRLPVELLKTNRDWDTDGRREELNHFFARLIFRFFKG
ncbi:MAG TPA: hypothetical protein VNQ76_06185 [Planctomicrobium sp.]|nr:hypothetical protein [Planctomicrobium sp.]